MREAFITMKVLPPTLNDIIAEARGNKFASASLKKAWTLAIANACKKAKAISFSGKVYLEYLWRIKNIQRDSDNITSAQKYILDGFVLAGLITDDNLTVIKSPVIHHFEKSDHDGVTIYIRDEEAWLDRAWKLPLTGPPQIVSEIKLDISIGNVTRKKLKPARVQTRQKPHKIQ